MRNYRRLVLIWLATCILFTGCGSNVVLETEANTKKATAGAYSIKASTATPAKEASLVVSGDIGAYLDKVDASVISEICEATDDKYSYIGEGSNGVGVISASSEEISKMYKESASEIISSQGASFKVESLDQMELDAIAVLKEISVNNEAGDGIFITYSGNDSFVSTAFGDHIGKSTVAKNSSKTGKYDTKGHFKEAGLSLEMSNFVVEKVIGGESAARLGIITIVVSADTKCIQNDGIYTALPWIPGLGETQNIKYAVQFWADLYEGSLHEVVIEDLSIVE